MRIFVIFFLLFAASCGNPQNPKERAAINLCKEYLVKILKDPESLKIYDTKAATYDQYGIEWYVELNYGAKNGFGGMDRETMTFNIIGDAITSINGKANFYKKGSEKFYPPQK